ncbi:MAG: nucleotide sugar dehydrogenase [Candidatus Diapherotrites archaeon]|nr:nucleotide sugar dehydrogenase [Candidatus Micrarchaeota archaeon]MBU1939809.1 nucleotide sugar dehydrogenase [Candidatus Micrarchaeota archaeon]
MNNVCIVGLGYVGKPLFRLCAQRLREHKVFGLELDKSRVEQLRTEIAMLRKDVYATTNPAEAISGADVIVVCVQTPVDEKHQPDLSVLETACKTVATHMKKENKPLIIIESTVYPGTCGDVLRPVLESTGLKAGVDFALAHCPERIDPGNEKWPLEKIPRVVAAFTPAGAKRAAEFYHEILEPGTEVLPLNSLKAAEAVKVTENTFRDINIAFVNELAKSFAQMGIDTAEVIRGASTKPFGYMPFHPGPGVGGHCIPVDPYYLIKKARDQGFDHKFLALAREINNSMPLYVAKLVEAMAQELGSGLKNTRICILGISYKSEIDDTRNSPAVEIAELLKASGADVIQFDPHAKKDSAASLGAALKGAKIVVLATAHKEFLSLLPETLKSAGVQGIVDARNVLDKDGIIAAGILYQGIGR